MTVQNIVACALAQTYSSLSEDSEPLEYAVNWVNVWLREALVYENSIRAAAGSAELTNAPTLTAVSDTVPYADDLVFTSLVYYLAALIEKDNGNNDWATEFRNRSISALDDFKRAVPRHVEDVYWGAED